MLNPHHDCVLIRRPDSASYRDRTSEIALFSTRGRFADVVFTGDTKVYTFGPEKLRQLVPTSHHHLGPDDRVLVRGELWKDVTEVVVFTAPDDPGCAWARVFRQRGPAEESWWTYPASDVETRWSVSTRPRATAILDYWRHAAELTDEAARNEASSAQDGSRRFSMAQAHEHLRHVDARSALAAYLLGTSTSFEGPIAPVILPFESNEDQRAAVEKALRHQVSVIDGPPGTGKTETILNLVANIMLDRRQTVGVVSFGNAAVDNVLDKLRQSGLGFLAARLGNKCHVNDFLANQSSRSAELAAWLAAQPSGAASDPLSGPLAAGEPPRGQLKPPGDQVRESEARLTSIWRATRELAEVRNLRAAYTREAAHFESRLEGETLPDLADLPLLRKDADRLLDYLAETSIRPELPGGIPGLVPRLRRYIRYGRLKDVDPSDTGTVLSLERAFYRRRIDELRHREESLERTLAADDAPAVRRRHQELSAEVLHEAIRRRYEGRVPAVFDDDRCRTSRRTPQFLAEYPVLLTTCHSITRNLARGTLLDWLIIDEATQTGLLEAALAMSCARHVVIVGDLRQLGHIVAPEVRKRIQDPPDPAYDVVNHSILSSVKEVYGQGLAQTMLREHFRCAPAIIDFCNQMFYDGQLIPLRRPPVDDGRPVLTVRRAAPGNHARTITRGARRGTYSQREIDMVQEYLTETLAGVGVAGDASRPGPDGDYEVGAATPFRLQAVRLGETLDRQPALDRWLADTVHRFQGRGARTMVLSTVADESWTGRYQQRFVDDPRLVNVAVSRAKDHLILVTNHDGLSQSTVVRALIDYVRYQDPEEVRESGIISVFDLLYREHSERLRFFSQRVHGRSRYLSENIIETLLRGILAEPGYEHLQAVPQVRLRDLLPGTDRLDERQRAFTRTVSSVDFAVYHAVSRRLLLVVEVNGVAYHENSPAQQERDEVKAGILAAYGVPLLVLPTNGSGEERLIREALDAALRTGASQPSR